MAVAVGKNTDTHAVGQLLPNAWGLYDMLGNAWEICLDVMNDKNADGNQNDPYQGLDVVDPVGPEIANGTASIAAGYENQVKSDGRRARRGGAVSDNTTKATNTVAYTKIYAEMRKNIAAGVGSSDNYTDVGYRLALPAVIP